MKDEELDGTTLALVIPHPSAFILSLCGYELFGRERPETLICERSLTTT
jgi:hypothetical protein